MNTTTCESRCQLWSRCFYGLGGLLLTGLIVGAVVIGQEEDQKVEEAKKIPLTEVYASFEQKELKSVWKSLNPLAKSVLREIEEKSGSMGASNIFLVRGNSINEAIIATDLIFQGSMTADAPGYHPGGTAIPDNLWLVGYLGSAGSTCPWSITSIVHKNKTIELHFKNLRPKVVTNDSGMPYCVWVPLGKLEEGVYTLHLIDDEEGQPTLSRRVHVKKQ